MAERDINRISMMMIGMSVLLTVILLANPCLSDDGDQLWEYNEGEPIIAAAKHQRWSASVSDGAGGIITAWVDEIDSSPLTTHVKAQRLDENGDQQWLSGGVWVTNNFRSHYPAICTDGEGGAIIAFQAVRYGQTEICVQRLDASGVRQWHPGGDPYADVVLTTTADSGWRPVICEDGAGGAFIGFGPRLAQVNTDGNILAPGVDGIELIPGGTGSFKLLYDGTGGYKFVPGTGWVLVSGGCYAAWRLTNGDLRAQWINEGVQWGANGYNVASHAYYGGFDMALDDAHDLLLTWMGLDGTPPVCKVKAQKIDTIGLSQWASGGATVLDSTSAGGNGYAWYQQRSQPVIATNGDGGAYIAWMDARDQTFPVTQNETDVYAQQLDENGNSQWSLNGILLPPWLENGVAIGTQKPPLIAADKGGGAVVAFSDQGICSLNVSAIRLDENGQKLWGHWRGTAYVMWDDWSTSGCTTEKDQSLSALIYDGSGPSPAGPIFVYTQSESSSNSDIYAQKVALSNLPPDNDACAAAQTIQPWETFLFGTVARATSDGSANCGDTASQPDVWYKYTAASAGVLNLSTCGTHDVEDVDLGMDSVLSVHSGCPGTAANQDACNDDWGGGACTGEDDGSPRDSALETVLAKGESVYIRVSRYDGNLGVNFKLNVGFEGVINDCLGDTDGDGDVDISDLENVAGDFGKTACGALGCYGDTEPDGDTDGVDLKHLCHEYGRIDCLP